MSTATRFKFRGPRKTAPFPWCVDDMSASDIDALGFLRIFQGTLDGILAEFWNREWLELGYIGPGGLVSSERPVVVAAENPITAAASTQPNARVCAEEYTGLNLQPLSPPLWAQTGALGDLELAVRFFYRSVIYDTDASEYVLLGTVEVTSDDGADKVMTSDFADPDFSNISTGYLDLFVSGAGVYNMYYDTVDYAVPIVVDEPTTNDPLWTY